jgi:hypothetical protein
MQSIIKCDTCQKPAHGWVYWPVIDNYEVKTYRCSACFYNPHHHTGGRLVPLSESMEKLMEAWKENRSRLSCGCNSYTGIMCEWHYEDRYQLVGN